MQKVALRAQLRRAEEDRDRYRRQCGNWRLLADIRDHELREHRAALSLARAGLLIALPHVESPPARALVGYALESSEIPAV